MLVSALSQNSLSAAHVLIAIARLQHALISVSVRIAPKYTACCLLGTMFPLWYLFNSRHFSAGSSIDAFLVFQIHVAVRGFQFDFFQQFVQRSHMFPENKCIIRK